MVTIDAHLLVDCCWAETNAIRQVFLKARVLWCQYHALQAMIRNITSKLAEKQGKKVSIVISQTERGQIKKMLWKLVKETFKDDDDWNKHTNMSWNSVITNKEK